MTSRYNVDPRVMTPTEKQGYVFDPQPAQGNKVRWEWVECLLRDIETFQWGIREGVQANKVCGLGGGNFSVPILVCTGIDLLSDLYQGMTDYVHRPGFGQGRAAYRFISDYFNGNIAAVPRTVWDAMRNGLTHVFMAKRIEFPNKNCAVTFEFGVEKDEHSEIRCEGAGEFSMLINSLEFFSAFEKAARKYEAHLRGNKPAPYGSPPEPLIDRYIDAWASIENHPRKPQCEAKIKGGPLFPEPPNKGDEADWLRSNVTSGKPVPLF